MYLLQLHQQQDRHPQEHLKRRVSTIGWAAWQADRRAHERAVRRKMVLAAPIAIVVAAVTIYLLLGR